MTDLNTYLTKELDYLAIDVSLPRGAVLFRDGDPVSAVYVIRKGAVNLEWFFQRTSFFQLLRRGEIAGLTAALNGSYSLTARAAIDCELGYIPTDRVLQLLDRNSHLCVMAMAQMTRELSTIRSAALRCRFESESDRGLRFIA